MTTLQKCQETVVHVCTSAAATGICLKVAEKFLSKEISMDLQKQESLIQTFIESMQTADYWMKNNLKFESGF